MSVKRERPGAWTSCCVEWESKRKELALLSRVVEIGCLSVMMSAKMSAKMSVSYEMRMDVLLCRVGVEEKRIGLTQ